MLCKTEDGTLFHSFSRINYQGEYFCNCMATGFTSPGFSRSVPSTEQGPDQTLYPFYFASLLISMRLLRAQPSFHFVTGRELTSGSAFTLHIICLHYFSCIFLWFLYFFPPSRLHIVRQMMGGNHDTGRMAELS